MKTKMTTMKMRGTKMMKMTMMTGMTIIIIPVHVAAAVEMDVQKEALAG
jgi:hypothetical protein